MSRALLDIYPSKQCRYIMSSGKRCSRIGSESYAGLCATHLRVERRGGKSDVRILDEFFLAGGRRKNPIHPQALESLKRYKADLKAGHRKAAEYWRGQAAAYFTANPSGREAYFNPTDVNLIMPLPGELSRMRLTRTQYNEAKAKIRRMEKVLGKVC